MHCIVSSKLNTSWLSSVSFKIECTLSCELILGITMLLSLLLLSASELPFSYITKEYLYLDLFLKFFTKTLILIMKWWWKVQTWRLFQICKNYNGENKGFHWRNILYDLKENNVTTWNASQINFLLFPGSPTKKDCHIFIKVRKNYHEKYLQKIAKEIYKKRYLVTQQHILTILNAILTCSKDCISSMLYKPKKTL